MLTLFVTAFVVTFALVAVIGHALLFTAVVFGRATLFAQNGAERRERAPSPGLQLN